MAPAGGSDNKPDILYGLHAVREALRSGQRPLLRLLVLRTDRQFFDLVRLARSSGVPVHVEPRPALDRLVPDGKHQGVVGVVAAKRYDSEEDILGYARDRGESPFVVILDGIEDPHNLGAVLRTSEAAGVHGVFVPERRAAGLSATAAKASAGALEYIRVGCAENVSRLLERLQAEGLWVYGVDPAAEKPYTMLDLRGPVALVFGNEGKGIRPAVLSKCDERVKIPMQGHVASLNVSVAAAVLLFEGVRQRSAQGAG
ncbi:MAG TPA: 23S rRNA (guanosine(2251)-2'-O)-methyltransferase RlmB [Nitrospiraceae bacterium]|nr:23S rRNA (guanosine(2251)-2'-O)-methyltransferase RlmB [Nitrospiraceae bacterium]